MSLTDDLHADTGGDGPSIIFVRTVQRLTAGWWGHETGGEHRDLSLVKQALAENWTGGEGADLQRVVNHLNLIPTFLNHSAVKDGAWMNFKLPALAVAQANKRLKTLQSEYAARLKRLDEDTGGGSNDLELTAHHQSLDSVRSPSALRAAGCEQRD
jgi:hypothetical protein